MRAVVRGWPLITARAVQGAGAALVLPLSLALLSAAFPPQRRAWALGIFSSVTGLAVLAGPVIGGAVAQGLSWQWIFWLNIPIGLVIIPLVLARIGASAGGRASLDPVGLVLATGGALGGSAVPCDRAGTRAIAEQWTTAFPDWRFDLLSLVAEGDRVAAHTPYSGTFTKPVLGVAPTRRFAQVDEMVIFRIAGGKVAEAWEVYDERGMWRQLGAPSPPG